MNKLKIPSNIVSSANAIRHNSLQRRALSDYIKRILYTVQDEIKIARKSGGEEIWYGMPITFDIPNMKNKDCQRIIWSAVFETLIEKGYDVKWRPVDGRIIVNIKWVTDEDDYTRTQQENLIYRLQSSS